MIDQPNRKQAFTIVAMLVVISIIGLLLGLVLPALSGVRRKGYKTQELNNLKQVNYAWLMYANQNNDAALPGYLTPDVQRRWKLKSEFPDHKDIPPAPNYLASDPNVAGPWTWRLLPYMEYSHDVVRGYELDDSHQSVMLNISSDIAEAGKIAEEPAFGYNVYYLGGYWRMGTIGTDTLPLVDYYNHCDNTSGVGQKLSIPTTVGQIKNSSNIIVFCSSTLVTGAGIQGPFTDDRPGSYLVTPPIMAMEQRWQLHPQGDNRSLQILATDDVFIPLCRYTNAAAVMFADGHIDQQQYNALFDQRRWIDSATDRAYKHAQCP